MSRFAALLVTTLCAAAAALFFYDKGRATPLPDGVSDKVACVSYAPFARGQTPFDEALVIPREQIAHDLKALSAFTTCVRTYSVDQGLSVVPEIAENLGMKVYAGAWIGREDAKNQRELARLITVANAHPQAIKGLIVGNEVLLRGEQTPAALSRYIAELRAGLNQPLPITYADVWEFWLKAPELAKSVDFVTIHLLPYWEDQPTPIDTAIHHVMAVWQEVSTAFAPKPILIGEVGWPSAGRRREGAEPSLVNQTRFVREFMAAAETAGANYHLIEAFDQPWKRDLEGTVGGAWGFFDADRAEKVFTKGPVVEWPDAPLWIGLAVVFGLLPLGYALFRREAKSAATVAILGLGGFAAAGTLSLQARHMIVASRGVEEWAINAGWLAISLVGAWMLVRAVAGLTVPVIGLARGFVLSLPTLRYAALCGMTVATLGLLFNARYRDFPVSMFLAMAVGFGLLRLPPPPREQKAVALLLGAAALGVLINEGWMNTHAWAWSATAWVLAAAVLVRKRRAADA